MHLGFRIFTQFFIGRENWLMSNVGGNARYHVELCEENTFGRFVVCVGVYLYS